MREVDGIRLIGICPPDAGLPVVRFVHPRVSGLVRAMREADAEVYYHNCAEAFTVHTRITQRESETFMGSSDYRTRR